MKNETDFDILGVQHRGWWIVEDCDCGGEIRGRSDDEFGRCIMCGKQVPWREMVRELAEAEAEARKTGRPMRPTRIQRMIFG